MAEISPDIRRAVAIASGEAVAASMLTVGLLARLKGRGLLSQAEINEAIDGALFQLEQFRIAFGDPMAVDHARDRLESLLRAESNLQLQPGERPRPPMNNDAGGSRNA